jgi:hypothetical protein
MLFPSLISHQLPSQLFYSTMAVVHRSSMPDVLDTEVFYDKSVGIWSSPNVSSLRYPIPVYDMEIPSDVRLRDLRQPRWLSNTYPFIAFWPKSVDFNGPIFSRLDICDRTISVEKAGPFHYQLHSNIINSWSRLERALEGLAKFLLSKGRHKAELGLLPFPRDCGYMSKHREPDFVYHCAYKSRDAFVALSTVCSFAIANLMDKHDHLRDEALWVKECRLQGVHPQWLEDLQRSFICNFTPGFRVGAYVNGYLSTWASHFPAFKTGSVPLLIWWGHEPYPIRDVLMKGYLPTGEEVEKAKFAYRTLPIPQPRENHNYSYNDYEPNDGFTTGTPSANEGLPPDPVPGSHQQLGETLQGFLDRVRQELAEYTATAEIHECIARIEAEQRADNERQDSALSEPTVGSAIYEWKRVVGGHELRTFVPRQEWKTRWSFSSPATRWFHGLMNEWSIKVDNSIPNSNPATIFDHHNNLIGEREPQSSIGPAPVQATSDGQSSTVILPRSFDTTTHSAEVYAEDVSGLYGDLVTETKVVSHSLKDILHKRYGFMAEVPYRTDVRMKEYKSVANESNNILSALNRIGLKEFHEDVLAQAGMDLYNFVAGNGSVPVAFPPLWDVAPTFKDQIIRNHSKLGYNKVDEGIHLIGIRTKAFEAQWYLILIPDASTVLQVFREDDMGVLATVRSLLDWGIPFNTVRCVDKKPKKSKRMDEKNIGLGYCDKHQCFDRQEYAAYEKMKQDILKKGQGQAARMAGGILWRLAQDIVGEKAVTRGPLTSVSVDGSVVGSMKKFQLVDDALSSSEKDIICGVYFVGSKLYLLVLLCKGCLRLLQNFRTRIHNCLGGRNRTSGRRAD